MADIDEILDLVDPDDNVIGQMRRSEVYAQHLHNFRAVNGFILNSQGQLWLPRRTNKKRVFRLCLDTSIGGHVETGESYAEAFERELREELNINANEVPVETLGYLTPHQHGISAFMWVYLIRIDWTPNYNTNDFVEDFWMNPSEFWQRMGNGEQVKPDLPKLIKIFFGK
jgi:isopentenyldiphosphate isomerase